MWKVLIADDEPKIRRGLRTSVEKMRPDMAVVAEAEDGEAALDLTEKHRPDILMIDIRMPFLNGLDLIEKIKEKRRDCVIIVVSGHDEFEYAKRALQLKVFEYVLKPVPKLVLAEVLERAARELTSCRQQDQYLAWAREQLERNMPLLREQFLREWVRGVLTPYEIEEQAAFLGIETDARRFMSVIHVVEHSRVGDTAKERERRLAVLATRKVTEETLEKIPDLSVFQDEQDNIVAIAGSVGGPEWLEAIGCAETRISRAVSESLIVAQKEISRGPEGVPETYEALVAELSVRSRFRSFVQVAERFIDSNFADSKLSLEMTADAAGISPGYLSRLLKQETGLSFIDYLTRIRITMALQLMNDPAMKVYEVAEAVGYQSQHYFSRAFKRVFGRSPMSYRRGGE